MKKCIKFLLFLILFVGFVLPGCDPLEDDCNCPELLGDFFDIESLALRNFQVDGNGNEAAIDPMIGVDWDDYILRGTFGVTFFGAIDPVPDYNFSLMSSAYSCSCLDNGTKGSQEKLTEFKVITRNDFDADHLANDTINSLINISVFRNEPIDLNTFLQTDTTNIGYDAFDLTLKSAPTSSEEFAVDILIRLDNGEEFLSPTGSVKLNM